VVNQDPEMIRLFLERGANANMTTQTGLPAIHIAVLPVSIAALAAGGADLNIKNVRGETPLTSMLKKRGAYRENGAQALIAAGADPNAPNAAGESPLFLALLSGLSATVLALLEKGADPREVRGPGDPVHAIFLMVTSFIDEVGYGGNEVLLAQYEMVILEMLRRGVSPDVRGSDNETILHMLVGFSKYPRILSLIEQLVRAGFNPNAIADDGMTPLENLAYMGGRNAPRLIALGFDPNFKNPDGTALLHRIANRPFGPGHQDAKQLEKATATALRFPGIDINLRNGAGETALHLAARRNNLEVVRLLVNSGADKTIRVGEALAVDLATDENVKNLLRGYAGKSRETVGLLERVFENPANVSMCPICLAFTDRDDGCRYMTHICKQDERHEPLYQAFRGRDGHRLNKIEWCTECGRICNNHHQHYNLAPHDRIPDLAPIDAARAPAAAGAVVHYLPDCRPSGGGGLEEKFLRFYQLIQEWTKLQAEGDRVTQDEAKRRAILAAWNGPSDERRTAEEQAVRQNLRDLAGLLRAPPAAGAPPPEVDAWNARVLSLKTFGIKPEAFPADKPPVAAEPDAPDFPRPEADRDLLPITVNANAGPAAAGGGGGAFCVVELGPHPDNRPTFRFRHRQPNGSVYEHPEEEAICGEDLVRSINSKPLFDGKCVSNPDVCKADLHPDEVDALGDQVPEDFRRNYRSKFNRLKVGRLGGGRRQTYRKKSRKATSRRQRGGKFDLQKMFRQLDEDEYTCAIGAF
jgi:hypothetical protein